MQNESELQDILKELDFYLGYTQYNKSTAIVIDAESIKKAKAFIKKQADEIECLMFENVLLNMKLNERR